MSAALRRVGQRWGAIALAWSFQLLVALVLAAPVVAALSGTGIADHPRSDAVLFEAGGLYLMEALRLGAGALLSTLQVSLLSFAVLGMLGLFPLAALLSALLYDGKLRVASWLGAAIAHVPSFVLIGGLTWLGRAALALFFVLVYSLLEGPVSSAFNERNADLVLISGALVCTIAFAALGVAADLARAARVRFGLRALGAFRAGLGAFGQRPLAAAVGWLIPASWSVALVALAAILVGLLAVDQPGSWRVLGAFVVHQLTAIGLIALRALWLHRSLELVGSQAQAVAPMV
jgi:hypothetical protein